MLVREFGDFTVDYEGQRLWIDSALLPAAAIDGNPDPYPFTHKSGETWECGPTFDAWFPLENGAVFGLFVALENIERGDGVSLTLLMDWNPTGEPFASKTTRAAHYGGVQRSGTGIELRYDAKRDALVPVEGCVGYYCPGCWHRGLSVELVRNTRQTIMDALREFSSVRVDKDACELARELYEEAVRRG